MALHRIAPLALTCLLAAMVACNEAGEEDVYRVDMDGDGFSQFDDCDDTDRWVYPGATEVCNGVDDDCDDKVDDDPKDVKSWYPDDDQDGFGHKDNDYRVESCDQPEGYVEDNTDCNDDSGAVYPGAAEVCNGVDDDCDDKVDDEDPNAQTKTWYADHDNDGEGSADFTVNACEQPEGFVSNADDCDDTDPEINSTNCP